MRNLAVPARTTIMVVLTLAVLSLISIMFYAYGINQYNIDFKFTTIHAEIDAVSKLKPSKKHKEVKMIVFRVNNSGSKLCMAKPCCNCVKGIKEGFNNKNYKLKANKCWYTNESGDFEYVKIHV
jgi:cytidine deaminase